MFDGFRHVQLETTDPQVKIHLRYGGQGPGLLLLHGQGGLEPEVVVPAGHYPQEQVPDEVYAALAQFFNT